MKKRTKNSERVAESVTLGNAAAGMAEAIAVLAARRKRQ